MSRLPHLFVLGAIFVAACGDTVPLHNHNDGDGGSAGAGENMGGEPEGGKVNGGMTNGGTVNGGTSANTAGDAGNGGGTAGAQAGGGAGKGSGGSTEGGAGNGEAGAGGDAGATGSQPGLCKAAVDGPAVSGSRLKAECVQAADGSQIVRRGRLFDSQLGVECAFGKAADNAWRCLPTLGPDADTNARLYFTDDKCENRIVTFSPPPLGCALKTPVYLFAGHTTLSCSAEGYYDNSVSIFPIGNLITPPTGPIYVMQGGMCVGHVVPNGQIWFTLGAEVPAASFVSGTPGRAP